MDLKLELYSNAQGLEAPTSYTPSSNCFIASNIQDIRFLFHYCPYAFASIFCTFIIPWHRTQVHASSLDMHADVNFNQKKIITQITNMCFNFLNILVIETFYTTALYTSVEAGLYALLGYDQV